MKTFSKSFWIRRGLGRGVPSSTKKAVAFDSFSSAKGGSQPPCLLDTATCRQNGIHTRAAFSTSPTAAAADTQQNIVQIVEVGPRDGLQNEAQLVSATSKIQLIHMLGDAGIKRIEVGAFVSPKWVPQMATSEEVLMGLASANNDTTTRSQPGHRPYYSVLVPNLKGLARALPFVVPDHDDDNDDDTMSSAGGGGIVDEVAVFASASEGFSQRNLACSVDESLDRFRAVVATAHDEGHYSLKVRGYVSCVVADPYDGPTSPKDVACVTEALLDMGCHEVSLGDTIGVGTPGTMRTMLKEVLTVAKPSQLALHCHDTYGQALANILVGIEEGIYKIDSSVAGLGGCPFANGASGNVATEDVVYMLHGMGLSSGMDLDRLIDAGEFISNVLDRRTESKVARAILSKRPKKQ